MSAAASAAAQARTSEPVPSTLSWRSLDGASCERYLRSTEPQPDFFVSYTSADRAWAEWVAWELEEGGYRTRLQAWDFLPGDNFVAKMDAAAAEAKATIAVVSDAYFRSRYAEAEWTAAFRRGTLLPVRIGGERAEGILGPVVSVDLLGLVEEEARERLRAAAHRFLTKERGKPEGRPAFPRAPAERPVAAPARFPGVLPPHWHVPRARSPRFTGREKELEAIAAAFSLGERVALVGMGGIGKSQLAAEYAHAHASDYETVWWVRAEAPVALLEDLAALARERELVPPEESDLEEAARAVRRRLEQEGGWLLLLDDAPRWEAVGSYVPQSGGNVLLTSRNPAWRGHATPLELQLLPAADAAAFLRARSGDATADGAAGALAEELGYLPLALEQAAAFVEERALSLEGYLERFRTRRAALLAEGGATGYPVPLAAAWELTLEALEREAPAAATLLELLSFLAPDDIPVSLLREGRERMPAPLAELEAFALEDDVIPALARASLLKREGEALSLHRLVQLITRTRMPAERRRERVGEAVSLLANAFSFHGDEPDTWPWTGRLLRHVLATAEHGEELGVAERETSLLLNTAGLYLWTRAEYADARHVFGRTLALGERVHGSEHPLVAGLVNNLGRVLHELGDYDGALAHYERALAIHERVYGPDHPEIATNVQNLGSVLQDLGDYAGARAHYERALAIDERAYGPDHPTVATRLNNLGRLLQALGDYAGARAHYERALAIHERVYGPDHSEVAEYVNNLGSVLQDLGDYPGARAHYERALAIDERVYGPDHPTVASRLNNLGLVLQALGDYAGARAHLERALAIDERAYGPDHPTVANRLNSVGGVLYDLGDYAGARAHFERALAIDERAYGPQHPKVAREVNDLGAVLTQLGDYAGARAHFERALAIDERAYGPEHPEVAGDVNNLGSVLRALGDYPGARAHYERALAILESTFGAEHPHTQTARDNVAALMQLDKGN